MSYCCPSPFFQRSTRSPSKWMSLTQNTLTSLVKEVGTSRKWWNSHCVTSISPTPTATMQLGRRAIRCCCQVIRPCHSNHFTIPYQSHYCLGAITGIAQIMIVKQPCSFILQTGLYCRNLLHIIFLSLKPTRARWLPRVPEWGWFYNIIVFSFLSGQVSIAGPVEGVEEARKRIRVSCPLLMTSV